MIMLSCIALLTLPDKYLQLLFPGNTLQQQCTLLSHIVAIEELERCLAGWRL